MFDLKAFFGTLAGRGSTSHATATSVTQLAKNLPEAEFYSTFIEIIKAVAKLNADVEVPLPERMQALAYVDDKAYSFHEKICRDLLANTGRPQLHLPSILSYLSELSNGYQICLRQAQRGKVPTDGALKQCALRALQHQLSLIKWSALCYLSADGSTWQQAYHIYAFAESQGFAREAIRAYETQSPASCEATLIRAAMLHLAQTDNLLPQEIEGVDRLLQRLIEEVHLTRDPVATDFQYVINLDKPQPPQLMRRGTTGNGCRYWSGESVLNRLADLMLAFEQKIPDSLLSAVPRLAEPDWQLLLEKLSTRWSQDGGKSMRRHERTTTYTDARVEVGLERIALALKLYQGAGSAQEDNWKISDVSPTGVGLVFLGRDIDQLKLGRLIWLSSASLDSTLGVIRRIQRLAEGGTRVGVEIIAENPLVVGLSEGEPGENSAPLPALYVTQANARNSARMLLIPERLARQDLPLIFSANGKAYQIRVKQRTAAFEEAAQVDFETLDRVGA